VISTRHTRWLQKR